MSTLRTTAVVALVVGTFLAVSVPQSSMAGENMGEVGADQDRELMDFVELSRENRDRSATLRLNGLSEIDAKTAAELAEGSSPRGSLHLNGLRHIDTKTAQNLSRVRRGSLQLNGLEEIDADPAQAFADRKLRSLGLRGLKTITVDVARALARSNVGTLYLDGVEELDGEVANEFFTFSGVLSLSGLRKIDRRTAVVLVQRANNRRRQLGFLTCGAGSYIYYRQRFYLNNLEELDAAVAEALLQWEGNELWLNSVRTLDRQTARVFANWNGSALSLKGLESLTNAAAIELARFDGNLLVSEKLCEDFEELFSYEQCTARRTVRDYRLPINFSTAYGSTFGLNNKASEPIASSLSAVAATDCAGLPMSKGVNSSDGNSCDNPTA